MRGVILLVASDVPGWGGGDPATGVLPGLTQFRLQWDMRGNPARTVRGRLRERRCKGGDFQGRSPGIGEDAR